MFGWIGIYSSYILQINSLHQPSPLNHLSPVMSPGSWMCVQISTADKLNLPPRQPYLSVMLNKGSLEVLMFTGSHSPRRVIRRAEQGALNDGREHSLRIERQPGRSEFVYVFRPCWRLLLCKINAMFFCRCVPSDLLQFRWTRRPRGRQRSPTTSLWAWSASSSVVFLQK